MHSLNLDQFLSGHVYAFVMIFTRLGAFMMFMPGYGEGYVSPRIRMMLALSISFVLLEPLLPRLPPMPNDLPTLVHYIGFEAVIGLFMGTLLRLLMSTLETTGMIIAMMTGLSNAMVFNPVQAVQSPLPSAFLGVVASTLIFVTGLDHMLLQTLVASYTAIAPAGTLMPGDMAQLVMRTVSSSYVMGIQLSMPFLGIGFLGFLAFGLMQKVIPNVQIFMITMPLQVWGGLFLLSLAFTGIMTVWLRYFDNSVATILLQR